MPIITITRGSLSATQRLADNLARTLNCRSISREDIIEHGKVYGIDEFLQAATRIMETKPPHSWDPQAAQIHNYLTIFKASLLDFVAKGDIIYSGLQTHYLLADFPNILKLKVIAPLEYRAKTLMNEAGITYEKAAEHITLVDSQRVRWAKFLLGDDFDEPTTYDMILNMSKLNLDAMTELIAMVVRRPEFRLHGGVMKQINDAHMHAVIEACLVKSTLTREMDLTIECDSADGHVKIIRKSISPSAGDWRKDIKDAVSEIPQIKTLEVTEFR